MLPTARAQFVQQGGKLVGTGAVGGAEQGRSVALSADGNTAIVGGPEDNWGTGNNAGPGAAWVFTRSGGVWTQQGNKLVGTGAAGGAEQGWSVALSGDGNTAIVGSSGDGAWVFTRSGNVWTQQGDGLVGTGNGPGYSVALSGDGNTALLGGWNDYLSNGGAAWVFTRSGNVWTQQGDKLVGTGAVGNFCSWDSVALSGDGNTALLGWGCDSVLAGAAWVFTRSGNVWAQQGDKLVGTGAVGSRAQQGQSVALSEDGNTAIIGGPGDSNGVGAAWVFTRSGNVWTQQGNKLVGTGGYVALSADGNTAIIGGPGDSNVMGAAWVYTRSGGVWTQQGGKLVGTGAVGQALQGGSVALSGDANTAIMGGEDDNGDAGAAWVFVSASTTPAEPTITAVENGASFAEGTISPGSWVAIFGTGLAPAGGQRSRSLSVWPSGASW